MKNIRFFVSIFILACLLGLLIGCSDTHTVSDSTGTSITKGDEVSAKNNYWPDDIWRESTPEEQGMDSAKLVDMLKYIQSSGNEIHSIVLIRNGYKVLDANFFPYKSNVKHVVNSCTKSITSTLFGIAVEEGLVKSVDTKLLDYYKDRSIKNIDEKKKELALKHLLTMTAGFDWSENGSYDSNDSWIQMRNSPDPVQFILDSQVKETPGTSFYYNTGATHLISSIIKNVTGQKTADYAAQKLFGPIGIKDFYWQEDQQGINIGGAGLFMTPQDMARFGYLFLQNGVWKDKQVVPENWIKQAVSKKTDTPSGLAGHYGYGYQWWMNNFGGYSARGYGGQYIFVLPDYNVVAVFTGALQGSNFFLPENLVESFIIASLKSTESRNENSDSFIELESLLKNIQEAPKSEKIPDLPAIVKNVSGKLLRMENGDEIYLSFPNGTNAEFRHGPSNNITIGLDDVYRLSDAGRYWPLPDHNLVAAKGYWKDEKSFIIKLLSLHEMDELTYTLTFEKNLVNLVFESRQGGELMRTKGEIK